MTADNSSVSELLALRNDISRRDIVIANAMTDLRERLSDLAEISKTRSIGIEASLERQTREIVELEAKLSAFEAVIASQNRQIEQLTEERALVVREVSALNAYINKISDWHHSGYNELPAKLEAGLAAIEALTEVVDAVRSQAAWGVDEILTHIDALQCKQGEAGEAVNAVGLPDSAVLISDRCTETEVEETIDLADITLVLESEFFDAAWYRDRYNLESSSPEDLAFHYLSGGWRSGFSPSPNFDSRAYLALNDDVAASALNPLVHYTKYGQEEGRLVQAIVSKVVVD